MSSETSSDTRALNKIRELRPQRHGDRDQPGRSTCDRIIDNQLPQLVLDMNLLAAPC